MGQLPGTAYNCLLKTQKTLDQVVGGLHQQLAEGNKHQNGVADAIQMNSNGALKIENVTKVRPGDPSCTAVKLQVKYRTPTNCAPDTGACVTMDCNPAPAESFAYNYLDLTPDKCVGRQFSIDASMFECNEQELATELFPILREKVLSMYSEYNKELSASLIAAAGSGYGTAALTSASPLPLLIFKTLASGGQEPQPAGFTDIRRMYRNMLGDSNLNKIVLVAGTDQLFLFQEMAKYFNNSQTGGDTRNLMLQNFEIFMDYTLAVPGAVDPIISFVPGAVDILEWYDFGYMGKIGSPQFTKVIELTTTAAGQTIYAPHYNEAAGGTFTQTKFDIGTPVLGKKFEVDLMILKSPCQKSITFKMNKRFDLFKVPNACPGENHNGILVWNATCGNWEVC